VWWLGLDLDASRYIGDRAAADGLVRVFGKIAKALGAFYAVAALQRGFVVRAGRLWGGAGGPAMNGAHEWIGLSPDPTWLVWIDRPYSGILRPYFPADLVESTEHGFLVRMSPLPADRDQLLAVFPSLPDELKSARVDIRFRDTTPVIPAKTLPVLVPLAPAQGTH
jgi:hypothetical protein